MIGQVKRLRARFVETLFYVFAFAAMLSAALTPLPGVDLSIARAENPGLTNYPELPPEEADALAAIPESALVDMFLSYSSGSMTSVGSTSSTATISSESSSSASPTITPTSTTIPSSTATTVATVAVTSTATQATKVPEATNTATPTPTETADPTDTEEPQATETAEPQFTEVPPTPTRTPEPVPTKSNTPTPTATPTSTPTRTPTPTPPLCANDWQRACVSKDKKKVKCCLRTQGCASDPADEDRKNPLCGRRCQAPGETQCIGHDANADVFLCCKRGEACSYEERTTPRKAKRTGTEFVVSRKLFDPKCVKTKLPPKPNVKICSATGAEDWECPITSNCGNPAGRRPADKCCEGSKYYAPEIKACVYAGTQWCPLADGKNPSGPGDRFVSCLSPSDTCCRRPPRRGEQGADFVVVCCEFDETCVDKEGCKKKSPVPEVPVPPIETWVPAIVRVELWTDPPRCGPCRTLERLLPAIIDGAKAKGYVVEVEVIGPQMMKDGRLVENPKYAQNPRESIPTARVTGLDGTSTVAGGSDGIPPAIKGVTGQ